MAKKCSICGKEAKYYLPEANLYYCEECARELFADLEHLRRVEEEAKALKKVISEKLKQIPNKDLDNEEIKKETRRKSKTSKKSNHKKMDK